MIGVGGTYCWGDPRFGGDAHFVYAVVEKVAPDDPRNVTHPDKGSFHARFVVLVLDGEHRSSPFPNAPVYRAGDTFTVADSSAIACNSVRFPAEE